MKLALNDGRETTTVRTTVILHNEWLSRVSGKSMALLESEYEKERSGKDESGY